MISFQTVIAVAVLENQFLLRVFIGVFFIIYVKFRITLFDW